MAQQQNQPRWPFAVFAGVAVGILLFAGGGQFFWKALNTFQVWPVGGVDGWFSLLWQIHKAPRGTLSTLHSNFQLRFYIPTITAAAGGLAMMIWSARAQAAACSDRHIRGRRYLTGKQALDAFTSRSRTECKADGAGLRLHPSLPPFSLKREPRHFLIFGGVGSGKTQTQLPYMQAAQARGDALLIYDNKGDFTARLPPTFLSVKNADGETVKRPIPTVLLAPWDKRSAIWEIAADVADKSAAREFAAAIVAESKGAPMWSNAARQVLTGCVVQLQATRPGRWGFEDLCKLVFRGDLEEHIATMKTYHPEGLIAVSGAAVTAMGILVNMTSYLSPVADLADAWPTPPAPGKGFSLRRWLMTETPAQRTVIIQGNGRFGSLAQAFAKALLTIAAQTITDPSSVGESTTRRLWVWLDEFPQMGEMNRVAPLLEVGRSKGVRVVLGVQDVSQLKAIYGQDQAAAWQSLIANQIVCQVAPGATSEFITQQVIGDREIERVSQSRTTGSGAPAGIFSPGGTRSTSLVIETRPVLLPSQLQTELGAHAGGVDVLWLGYGDALRLTIPYTKLPDLRPAVEIADWTAKPGTREALVAMVAEVEAAQREPAAPLAPAVPAPAAPAAVVAMPVLPAAPAALAARDPSDSLSFLDDGDEIDDRDDDEEGEQGGMPTAAGNVAPTETLPPPRLVDEVTDPAPPLVIPKPLADQAKEAVENGIKDKLASVGEAALVDSVLPGAGHLLEIVEVITDAGQAVAGPAADILPPLPQPQQRKKFKRRAEQNDEAAPDAFY